MSNVVLHQVKEEKVDSSLITKSNNQLVRVNKELLDDFGKIYYFYHYFSTSIHKKALPILAINTNLIKVTKTFYNFGDYKVVWSRKIRSVEQIKATPAFKITLDRKELNKFIGSKEAVFTADVPKILESIASSVFANTKHGTTITLKALGLKTLIKFEYLVYVMEGDSIIIRAENPPIRQFKGRLPNPQAYVDFLNDWFSNNVRLQVEKKLGRLLEIIRGLYSQFTGRFQSAVDSVDSAIQQLSAEARSFTESIESFEFALPKSELFKSATDRIRSEIGGSKALYKGAVIKSEDFLTDFRKNFANWEKKSREINSLTVQQRADKSKEKVPAKVAPQRNTETYDLTSNDINELGKQLKLAVRNAIAQPFRYIQTMGGANGRRIKLRLTDRGVELLRRVNDLLDNQLKIIVGKMKQRIAIASAYPGNQSKRIFLRDEVEGAFVSYLKEIRDHLDGYY